MGQYGPSQPFYLESSCKQMSKFVIYSFHTPFGIFQARLWAKGKYGFILPKRVEIYMTENEKSVYILRNRMQDDDFRISNRSLVRIAITHFLASPYDRYSEVEVDLNMPLFDGALHTCRTATLNIALNGTGSARSSTL